MRSKSEEYYKAKELRKVIAAHNLMSGNSSDAWDKLIHRVLNKIEKGIDFDDFIQFIESELIVTYGFFKDEVDAKEIAESIEEWWLEYTDTN